MNITLTPISDGLNTIQIQNAVDKIALAGGGTLSLSAGKYLSGSIELKSNVSLNLEAGCVLKASGDIKDFPFIGFVHNEMGPTKSFIWSRNCENITLCGDGIIDFSDEQYYALDEISSFEIPNVELTVAQKKECCARRVNANENTINQPIFFESCKHIKVGGIKLLHSTFWTLTFSRCDDIHISGITVDNRRNVGNSDGIHLCASKNAVISDCNISTGDDCVAITCITDEEGISENITIVNCNFQSTSAAIRLGHLNAKVRNICVSNINISDSNRGIAVFAKDGGKVSNVHMSNINMETRVFCGEWWGRGEALFICAANSNGIIENITFENIYAESENGAVIVGEDNNVRNITLSNFNISLKNSENRKLLGNALDMRPNGYVENHFLEPVGKYVSNAQVYFKDFNVF